MRTGWAMPRSGAIVVEVRVRERLLRRRMCVQRLNSRCAHNSIAPPSWTRIDYGICPVGTTAVTVRNSRRMARRRVFCTFPVRNSCLSELPRPVHHSCTVRTATDRRKDVDAIRTLQNHRYARARPSIVEYRCWMCVRAAASALGVPE